jgi:polyferredoxin
VRERRADPALAAGDCIDCHQCVAVCPTGVDIRNGNQLECIHCTACIDACDAVMKATARPPGLIRFASEVELAGGIRRILRPRSVIYAVLLTILLTIALWRIAGREDLVATALRPTVLPQLLHEDGSDWVRQTLPFSLYNRSGREQHLRLEFPAELRARVFLQGSDFVLPPNGRLELQPIVDVPASLLAGGRRPFALALLREGVRQDLTLVLRQP